MRFLLAAVCLSLLALAECGKGGQGKVMLRRCRLGETCYPSYETLCKLRKSLTGRLITPSHLDYRNVVLMLNRRVTRYPGFVVEAMSSEDIKHAMDLAREYNLQVSIKYDGFDRRGSNDGGMVIDMTAWKKASHIVATERSPAGEVTLSSGHTWGEAYSYVDTITTLRADNTPLRRLVVGSRYNQESVGRFTENGGIGPLSRNYGLAADNLLEATLVTVKGKLLKVSSGGVWYHKDGGWVHYDQNTHLFYAIRGGGSGTFGVLISLTFKLHFAPLDLNQFTFQHKLHQSGQFVGKAALRDLLLAARNLDDVFGMELYSFSGNRVSPDREGSLDFVILQNMDSASTFTDIGNAILTDNSTGTLLEGNRRVARSKYLDYSSSQPDLPAVNGYYATTFIQPDVLDKNEKLEKLTDLILSVVNVPTVDSFSGCQGILLGGAINKVPVSTTPVNPLLRSAFMELTCYVTWPEDGDCDGEKFREAAEELTDKMEEVGGDVLSEDTVHWKKTIFGPNYGKLVDVKRMVDPDNFLYCEACVGSDFRFDCFEHHDMQGMQLSTYLYYSSCGYMFNN